MKMKIATIIAVVAIPLVVFGFMPNSSDNSKVNNAILNGNVEKISEYFGNELNLSIMNTTNKYGKQESTKILKEFFKQNKPLEFNPENENSNYVTGRMITEDGKPYVIRYTIKQRGNQKVITAISIKNELF